MTGRGKVLAGVGGRVWGEVVPRVLIRYGRGGLIRPAEGVAKAAGPDEARAAVGEGVGPFMAEHVGEPGVVAEDQVGELGSGDGGDVNIVLAVKPAVAVEGCRDEPHGDVFATGIPEPKSLHFPGDLLVGAVELTKGDEVPSGTAGGLAGEWHG